MSDQISTAAELDALPAGTIVQVCDDPTAPNSFWLYGTGGLWWTFAAEHGYTSAEMAEDWAFTVLYRPGAPARTEPTEEQVRYIWHEVLERWGTAPSGRRTMKPATARGIVETVLTLLPQRVAPSEDVRQIVAVLASRLGHVETHWVPDDRATPMPTAEVLREFDAALTAHDAEVRAQALRLTLAQDAAEASLQLAEPMMDAAAGILADDENSAELPTRQAWNAAFLEIGVAIAYGLLDVAAAIREANHA